MKKFFSFQWIKRIVFSYMRALYNDFDAVKEAKISYRNSANSHQLSDSFQKQYNIGGIHCNVRYLLPFLVNLFFYIDTLIIYWKASFRYENIRNSDKLIGRKIFPTKVWHEADLVLPVGLLWSSGILFCALFHDLAQWNGGKMNSVV